MYLIFSSLAKSQHFPDLDIWKNGVVGGSPLFLLPIGYIF